MLKCYLFKIIKNAISTKIIIQKQIGLENRILTRNASLIFVGVIIVDEYTPVVTLRR